MRRVFHQTYACAALAMAALCLSAASVFAAEPLDLAQHKGKVVLVDFWASWCEPCRHSFPWLNEMQAKYGDFLVVIGVNVDRERADAIRFLAQVPAQFKVIYDPDGELASQYDVMGMPSSFVFDTSGALVDQHIGFRKSQRVEREEQLRKLLPPTLLQSRTNQ
jgi:cytochrome c biogenesis protein CcmG, thiol:disulfide interchange protein DsbE